MGNSRPPRSFSDRYPQYYGGKKAKNVTFIVTHRCNLRCSYCYEHNKSEKRMSFETAKAFVDLLFKMEEEGSRFVNSENADGIILDFIGGEPLLEIELIDRVVSYFLTVARQKKHRWAVKYMLNMSTNGVLGEEPAVKRFLKKYEGRLSVSVTIDGSKEAHDACRVDCNGCGSYDRAIKMYRAVSEKGRKRTKYTVAPANVALTAESVKHLVENEGIDDLHINCVYEEGWTVEHASLLYRELKEISDYLRENRKNVYVSILDWEAGEPLLERETGNWCGGTGAMLACDVDGVIVPCMRYSSVSISAEKRPVFRIGDVKNGIGVLKSDRERLELLEGITRQSQSDEKCLKCSVASGCGWCSGYNYEVNGTPDRRVTYICQMHKARVLAQCYHRNMLAAEDPNEPGKKMYIPRSWAVEIVGEEEYRRLVELEEKVLLICY